MSETPRAYTRLFRANSPSDIICASILADALPACRHILALSTDKSHADIDDYRECYRSLAEMHRWQAVVDLSGIAMVSRFEVKDSLLQRVRQVAAVKESIRELRVRLASVLDLPPSAAELKTRLDRGVDEVYLTCLHHPDVLALCQVLPGARKIYYPHTFDSLGQSEIGHYSSACASTPLPARTVALNRIKRALWGEDAVPQLRVEIDAAYTFKLGFPWTTNQYRIDDRINRPTIERVFSRLPQSVRDYYLQLAGQCGENIGLLVINAEDLPRFSEREVEAYRFLAQQLVERRCVSAILVKPHSRGSLAHAKHVVSLLRDALPDVTFRPVARYHFYPIEVVMAPFRVVACAGLATTSLRTLSLIYGIDAFCPLSHLRGLYKEDPAEEAACARWIDEYKGDVICV